MIFKTFRICYEHGGELLHLNGKAMDNFTTTILDGMGAELGNPGLPKYFHLGIYQIQELSQMYLSNGHNV